jgi:hypothetical protein
MSDGQTKRQKSIGLYTFPSILEAPPGALTKAQNAVLDQDGIIANRRGFQSYASLGTVPDAAFEYLEKLLVYEGGKFRYDAAGDGVLVDWSGAFDPPEGQRLRGLEVDGKWIFLTDLGPYIQESPGDTPRRTGFPQGLDIQLQPTGTGLSGFLPPNHQIAYKVIFGKDKLPPGAPSFPEALVNAQYPVMLTKSGTTVTVTGHTAHGYTTGDTIEIIDPVDATYVEGPHVITVTTPDAYTYTVGISPTTASTTASEGKAFNVVLTATLSAEMQAGWTIEIYRTFLSADQTAEPGDFFYKVTQYVLTAGDISNGFITFTDTRADDFLKTELYTNAGTREGQGGANDRPPWAKFLASFRGHVFYGNIRREHQASVTLLDVAGMINGDTFTITSGGVSTVFTAGAVENVGTRTFKLWTTEPLGSVNVRKTAKSLIHIINRNAGPVSAWYPDLEVGLIQLKRRDLQDVSFTLSSTFGTLWSPALSSVESDPNAKPFQVARSKFQKPEAVPELSTDEVGRITRGINGMVSLKESLLIFAPGAWELTGETDALAGKNFSVRELDSTVKLIAPDTLVALDNSAFGWFDQGILRISPAGSAIVSRQIEDLIQPATQYSAFSKAFAVAYESYHKYLLFMPGNSGSTTSDSIYVYDYLQSAGPYAGTWAGPWTKAATCGVVLPSSDAGMLYIGRADVARISQERKTLVGGGEDHLDEEEDTTVVSFNAVDGVSTLVVTWSGATIRQGWMFFQDSYRSLVDEATDNGDGTWSLILNDLLTLATGAATLAEPIDMLLAFADDSAGNPAVMKQFGPAIYTFTGSAALTHEIGFSADTEDGEYWYPPITQRRYTGWGTKWGVKWGDPGPGRLEPLRIDVPREMTRCRRLRPLYRHRTAKERVGIIQVAIGARAYSDRVTRLPV